MATKYLPSENKPAYPANIISKKVLQLRAFLLQKQLSYFVCYPEAIFRIFTIAGMADEDTGR
jgi:hypothetical protein